MSTREQRWASIDASVLRVRTPDFVPGHWFHVLTNADWARSLRWYRLAEGRRNPVRDQIRSAVAKAARPEKILDRRLGKSEPEVTRGLTTDCTDNTDSRP